jgi:hypothetical protein
VDESIKPNGTDTTSAADRDPTDLFGDDSTTNGKAETKPKPDAATESTAEDKPTPETVTSPTTNGRKGGKGKKN